MDPIIINQNSEICIGSTIPPPKLRLGEGLLHKTVGPWVRCDPDIGNWNPANGVVYGLLFIHVIPTRGVSRVGASFFTGEIFMEVIENE